MENPRHPSLRTKEIRGQDNIFEASITMDIRMTWQYTEEVILLRNIGKHDTTLKKP
jgi:mRNA-degrading endonuclease YafQ of YafQ-DinJ toxin-antitoxin module